MHVMAETMTTGGVQNLLERYRDLEDHILNSTTNPRQAKRCVQYLMEVTCTPDKLSGHSCAFTKVLCGWVWYLCLKIFESEWLHPQRLKWIKKHAVHELKLARTHGDKDQLMQDVAECWKELRAERAGLDREWTQFSVSP